MRGWFNWLNFLLPYLVLQAWRPWAAQSSNRPHRPSRTRPDWSSPRWSAASVKSPFSTRMKTTLDKDKKRASPNRKLKFSESFIYPDLILLSNGVKQERRNVDLIQLFLLLFLVSLSRSSSGVWFGISSHSFFSLIFFLYVVFFSARVIILVVFLLLFSLCCVLFVYYCKR